MKTKCKICKTETHESFELKLLKKYNVKYYICPKCNFIQTEKPYWLDEAYSSVITDEDSGLINRNIKFSKITLLIIYFFFDRKAQYLDYAGGYGVFTNIMRNFGIKFFNYDPYCENLFSKEFNLKRIGKKYEAITMFEYLEHSKDPIKDIKTFSKKTDTIIFSTELHDFSNELYKKNWYYFYPKHGQHISLYSINTLKLIAKEFNFNLYTNGKNFHILTKKELNKNLLKLIFKTYDLLYLYPRKRLK